MPRAFIARQLSITLRDNDIRRAEFEFMAG